MAYDVCHVNFGLNLGAARAICISVHCFAKTVVACLTMWRADLQLVSSYAAVGHLMQLAQ